MGWYPRGVGGPFPARARRLAAALLSLTLPIACGGSKTIPRESLVGVVRGNLERGGITDEGIECPESIAAQAGVLAQCTATVDGQSLVYEVQVEPDGEGLSTRPVTPTLVVARAREEIRALARKQGYEVESLECDGQVWVVTKGSVGRCTLVAGGRRYRYTATFSGQGARHRARIEPAEADAAP